MKLIETYKHIKNSKLLAYVYRDREFCIRDKETLIEGCSVITWFEKDVAEGKLILYKK